MLTRLPLNVTVFVILSPFRLAGDVMLCSYYSSLFSFYTDESPQESSSSELLKSIFAGKLTSGCYSSANRFLLYTPALVGLLCTASEKESMEPIGFW